MQQNNSGQVTDKTSHCRISGGSFVLFSRGGGTLPGLAGFGYIALPLSGPHANSCMIMNGTWSAVWLLSPQTVYIARWAHIDLPGRSRLAIKTSLSMRTFMENVKVNGFRLD